MNPRTFPRRDTAWLTPALLPLALLFVALLPAGAYADPIVLTGGEIVVDRANGIARVNLVGDNFSVSYFTDLQFSSGFSAGQLGTSTFGCGCDGFGTAVFGGLRTIHFTGGGTYDSSIISGTIRLYSSVHEPPILTLSYVGTGFLTTEGLVTRFTITNGPAPVPEPGTVLLLGSGLAALAAGVRKRRVGRRAAGESPPSE